ncbi:MAG TPA: HAD family hydrolase [Anaerolineales bacterium]|nr:HAD family hydrolase [Anaerolineales bacterium]
MSSFDRIAFDADDTLWHNERLYKSTEDGYAAILSRYGISGEDAGRGLFQTESRNIRSFGYGIKSFALSMIESAAALTGEAISARDVLAILDLAKAQLNAPVELLPEASEAVSRLAERYRLMLITKGELLDQERKLTLSGLGRFFQDIEIVSDKTTEVYARLFQAHGLAAERVLMVGNSLRSDILPILALGGTAAYIPYELTWQHEAADAPSPGTPRFHQLEHLGLLPGLLERLEAG